MYCVTSRDARMYYGLIKKIDKVKKRSLVKKIEKHKLSAISL